MSEISALWTPAITTIMFHVNMNRDRERHTGDRTRAGTRHATPLLKSAQSLAPTRLCALRLSKLSSQRPGATQDQRVSVVQNRHVLNVVHYDRRRPSPVDGDSAAGAGAARRGARCEPVGAVGAVGAGWRRAGGLPPSCLALLRTVRAYRYRPHRAGAASYASSGTGWCC